MFKNLFVGYNEEEDFRILICDYDKDAAYELADRYAVENGLKGQFEIYSVGCELDGVRFDCDYVITLADYI